jgi:hypothetical protein
MQAKGTFEVKVAPVEVSPVGKDADLGRYTLGKTFHGDLEGTAKATEQALENADTPFTASTG